ncbi:MAG TPA: hypothetical protein PLP19_08570 [bacterium]|nr:hypothetical protein [bacterium]HPN43527.1 hypothetical protein [bacterium]
MKSARFFSIIFILVLSCNKSSKITDNDIVLVKIGDKTITVNEFIRRSEYTVRPFYCAGNSYAHKKIVLNSLIAEKLMALEAGNDNDLFQSKNYQLQMRGRKEQAMRLVQFYREVYDQVKIDTTSIKKYLPYVKNSYEIAYFNINDPAKAGQIEYQLYEQRQDFRQVYSQYTELDTIPHRTVEWSIAEDESMIDRFFTKELHAGDILGPISTDPEEHIFIKILKVTKQPMMTQSDMAERLTTVKTYFTEKKAAALYDQKIYAIMKGKSIEFVPETLKNVAQLLGEMYFITDTQREKLSNREMFQQEIQEKNYEQNRNDLRSMAKEQLFTENGNIWTVGDFLDEIIAHPLVFREKKFPPKQFGKQLQYAIIDMVRDIYLNKEAYKSGYDKHPGVIHDVAMWQDHYGYLFNKAHYLKAVISDSSIKSSPLQLVEQFLNPYIDSLQIKYNDQIEINLQAFEKINLTQIHMAVFQEKMPYTQVVPEFPVITSNFRLDYGIKMNEKQ